MFVWFVFLFGKTKAKIEMKKLFLTLSIGKILHGYRFGNILRICYEYCGIN